MTILIDGKLLCTLKGVIGLNTLVFKTGDQSGPAHSIAVGRGRACPRGGGVAVQLGPDPLDFFSLIMLNCAFRNVLC